MFRQWRNSLFASFALCLACARAAQYRPVVMMHGMDQNRSHVQRNMDSLRAKYPGIYVTSLAVYEDASSMVTPMDKQLGAVIEAIQSDGNLTQGFNFYGESNGALLARSFVTTTNSPPVYNLVAISGPQAGVGECPKVDKPGLKQLCGDAGTALDIYHWPFCAFCCYWKGRKEKVYLKNSVWLADINNDRWINQTRRGNMMSLNKYMASVALQDEMVQPPQSAWHTYWYWDDDSRSRTMPLNETDGYQNDALGLKTLSDRGDLILNSYDGAHLGYTMDWWNQAVAPMFDNFLPEEAGSSKMIV